MYTEASFMCKRIGFFLFLKFYEREDVMWRYFTVYI